MFRPSVILTFLALISSFETSKAAPGDSPDIVYINGLPCNNACQSYMAWSRRTADPSAPGASQPVSKQQPLTVRGSKKPRKDNELARATKPMAHRPIVTANQEPASRATLKSAHSEPAAAPEMMRRSKLEPETGKGIAAAPTNQDIKTAVSSPGRTMEPAPAKTTNDADTETTSDQRAPPPVQGLATEVQRPETTAPIVKPSAATPALDPEKVPAPTATAPSVLDPSTTPFPPGSNAVTDPKPLGSSNPAQPTETNSAALESPNADRPVAILFVRPEIKSISDLANKVVAIDDSEGAASVKSAMETAGAAAVQLSEDQKSSLVRVMDGDVPGAVVAVGPPGIARRWKGIPSFNVLLLPLAPASGNANHG